MAAPAAYLVTGIPGAGKTTVARLLAQRFPRAVHVESDRLQEMVVSGGLWPTPEMPAEAARQLELRARNAAMLASNYAAAGFVAVVDDVVVSPGRLALYREHLTARPLALVVLAPATEVTLHRDEHRGYKRVGDTWSYLADEQRAHLGGIGLWLDSAALTADETVDAILERTAVGEGRIG